MILARPFIGDTMEWKPLHVHCSGLLGDRTLCQYAKCSQRMVLKWSFVRDNGKAFTHSLFSSLGRLNFELRSYFQWEYGLEKAICQLHWGRLCLFIAKVYLETELHVDMKVLLRTGS